MSADYYTLVTDIGHAKLTNALALGQAVTLTHFAIGDGNGAVYDPVQTQTALKREVYRAPINAITVDPDTPTWLTVEAVIPATVGGWTVREAGIFDADGDLIAIAKYPESVKPALTAGVGKDLYCRLILQHGNVSTVTLKIDPAIVLATRDYVDDTFDQHIAGTSHAHPDASTTVKGLVELATQAETLAGQDDERAVTPFGLTAALAAASSPDYKVPVRVATTGNLADLSGLPTVDGVTLAEGDRVLVKDQPAAADNGIYIATAGAWSRAPDAVTGKIGPGALVPVREGAQEADTVWMLKTDGDITVGATPVAFVQVGRDITDLLSQLATVSGQLLGIGQAWQVVTRANGTTYYNTTTRPIMFICALQNSSSSLTVHVNGVVAVPILTGGNYGPGEYSFVIVPPGASYSYSASSPAICSELR